MTYPTISWQEVPAFLPSQLHTLDRVLFQSFSVSRTQPIWQALDRELIEGNCELLVFEHSQTGGVISLLKSQMAYHHLAQGMQHGEPWLLCYSENSLTATSFFPVINEKIETFAYAGHYRGLPMLKDEGTQSIWHPITGTCLSGKKHGQGLKSIGQVFHIKASQVERSFPQAHIAISQPNLRSRFLAPLLAPKNTSRKYPPFDPRLPDLEEGLGIWSENCVRYYPNKIIRQHHNVIHDHFNGRDLLIMIDPIAQTPYAFTLTTEKSAWAGDKLWLDANRYLRDGQLFDSEGNKQYMSRPWQIYARWFSFSTTFPDCEIYGVNETNLAG